MSTSHDKTWSLIVHRIGERFLPMWKILSLYGGFLYLAFFIGLFIASLERDRLIWLTTLSFLLTLGSTFLLRYLIQRPRPSFMKTDYIPWLNDYSFPSLHASLVFSISALESWLFLTPVISFWGILFASSTILLAFLISISRIMLGVHYISDIVVGAGLGIFMSALVIYFL